MALNQYLELRTLLTTNIISMLICFSVMFIVWWDNRDRFPATTHWLYCLGVQFLSFPLILLRGKIPDVFSIVIASWLITSGFILLVRGVAVHVERPYSLRHDHALQLVFLIIQMYFTYIDPNLMWRSINYSVFLTWLSLECVWLIYRTSPGKRFAAHILAYVMSAYAMLFFGRIVYYAYRPPNPEFFQASAYDLFLYVGTQALLVSLTFCLVLMVNRRLTHDLQEDSRNRLKAEEEVRINLNRLARAELASKTGYWEFRPDTGVITYSPGAARIYGVSGEQADPEIVKAVPLPEFRSGLDAAMRDLIENGLPYDVEFTIRTVDTGELREIHSTAELNPAQRTVFGVIQDITERKRIEHDLQYLVQVDPLTRVFSRRHFMAMTERELANAARYASSLSALMLDIDHFKKVNDTYGHQVGDQVLKQLGRLFSGVLREVDIVGRYGGEEFAVVLPKTGLDQAIEISERLRQAVAASPLPLAHGLPLTVTVSIGVTELRDSAENIDALLARADKALYDAKHLGRNRVCVRPPGEHMGCQD